MANAELINQLLLKHAHEFYPLVEFNKHIEKYVVPDFSINNQDLSFDLLQDTPKFSEYIDNLLFKNQAKFGLGGFMEHRTVYARSKHFDTADGEPRRLHLGLDVWAAANTPVFSFMDAKVHSFAFNNTFGDYGATIILEHQLEAHTFYSLYGHVSRRNLDNLFLGKKIKKGVHFCDFGIPEENGNWPPHLHFQLMTTMDGMRGDYPGVAKYSEKLYWLDKIPDPSLVMKL